MSQVPEESEIGVDNLISESDPIKKKFFFLSTISDEETEWLDKKYVSSVMDALCQIDKDMGAKWEDVVLNPEISTAKFLENKNVKAQIKNVKMMLHAIQKIEKAKDLMVRNPASKREVERFVQHAKRYFLSSLVDGINAIPLCFMWKKHLVKNKAQEWLIKKNGGMSVKEIIDDLKTSEEKVIFLLAVPITPRIIGSERYSAYVSQALEKIALEDETFKTWSLYHRQIHTRLESATQERWCNLDLSRVFRFRGLDECIAARFPVLFESTNYPGSRNTLSPTQENAFHFPPSNRMSH
eukprot:Gregarina_sp_Poly_1__2655@NODE_1724_length_3457_cov_21_558702_g908_i2_p1_GENE_NODE_1724_length_3457_cov_21_558702_g908_i2NODE_1724_length_3457_cov_21_558702_g908_i2_p1_ORF_typecomplete_len296_score34_67Peptidase_M24_C/PF16188_5/0_73Peptidase_M24_C/PF16188_5/5_7e03Peptidase_M24_C/PF16188_5/47_NODE_1724_length_3457_cov_21_558702_g908_i219782865